MTRQRSDGREPLSWRRIQENLENLRHAIDRGWQPTPAEKQRVLEARAKRLAQPVESGRAADRVEFVQFQLAHERYAVASTFVREVFPLTELTPLPGTPPFVQGLVNIRGEIVSVIDLKKFFELPEKGLTDLNRVVVLHTAEITVGVLADVLLGVSAFALDELQRSLPTLTGVREDYLLGITDDHIVVLDAAKLLTDRRIIVNEPAET